MSTAWTYIWYIFDKFVNFIFNETTVNDSGATVGWIAISIFVFGILIKSILNLPRSAPKYTGRYENVTTGRVWSDQKGTIHSERRSSRVRVK